ncbi:hypothetical protein F53441_6554 [Fusarium austroafricanum]|uniref:Uncharacterized protein n=1 Tax=Fusarium austroafricanum TaxID=2364996 RepID=A0A8H4P6V8_9HYPO|nr:hypothetical protein F53441_6554 [Fusarium austroafricanum]
MYFNYLLLPALFAAVGAADDAVQLTYRTATITQCFIRDTLTRTINGPVGPTCVVKKPANTGDPITIQVQAPNCEACGCKTCVQTMAYTTKFYAFCSTGLYEQDYVITETYSGLDTKPTMDSHSLPFGFTCDVQTCTSCGPEPITATITYPVTNRPYMNAVSHPTQMPAQTNVPVAKPEEDDEGYDSENGSNSKGGSHSNEVPSPPNPPKPNNGQNPDAYPGSGSESKPEQQETSAVKAPGDDSHGFQSSVRSTAVYPGGPSNIPVIVSGAGRHLGLAGAGMAFIAILQLLFL